MSTSSRSRSSGRVLQTKGGAAPSSVFAASSSSFSARSTSFFTRSSSPTRVNLLGSSPPAPSVRFSFDRQTSPSRSISSVSTRDPIIASGLRKTCMCSPTTHPGSFRCSLHKRAQNRPADAVFSSSHRLNARRSAMTNSLVRIGTVEGELVKRALAALIRPSSHQQRRRADFRPRPSRLSKMEKANDS